MGAGASAAAALDLPERLDEAACREAAGELFNEATFAALAKDDAGTVLREDALAAFDDGLGEVVDPNAPVAEPEPEPEPEVPKTAEELSDEEFEEEMAALGRQTVKVGNLSSPCTYLLRIIKKHVKYVCICITQTVFDCVLDEDSI
jgi:hypothetical protein